MNGQSTIAIIAWGSLIWDQGDLEIQGSWQLGGPRVHLEFSRISGGKRLTIVIDEQYGVPCETYYALSSKTALEDAVRNLTDRERTRERHIGFIDFRSNTNSDHQSGLSNIRLWGSSNGFSSAIWTALPSNFFKQRKQEFSVANAVSYLNELTGETKSDALKYIRNAPAEVSTPLRTELAHLGIV